MKRHALRRLRASILQTQAWSIYEPALETLLALVAPGQLAGDVDADQINARLNITGQMETPLSGSTVQLIGGLAVLPVMGVLQLRPSWITRALGWTAIEQLERDFKAAVASDQVKAIVLYCDSPGGVAAGCDECAATMFAARNVKPVFAFVRGQCCSAAYYLASAASKIYATPSSLVGSIGTIFTHIEYAQAIEKMGMGVTVIKHGERKADGNPYEKLSPAAKAALQQTVSAYGEMFDKAVAKHRNVKVADVKARFGQGQAFIASEAKERGLIDDVKSWDNVLAGLKAYAAPLTQPGQAIDRVTVQGAQLTTITGPLSFADATLAIDFDPFGPFGPFSASAIPAGASAGPAPMITPPAAGIPAGAAVKEERPVKVSARVRAALFARGFISAQDADDSVCLVALGAYFAARGEACPQEDDKTIAALMSTPATATATATLITGQPLAGTGTGTQLQPSGGAQPAANVQAAHDRELAEARTAAAADERTRQTAIRASAKLLNLSDEAVTAAINGGKPHAEIVAAWHTELAAKEKPIGQGGTVNTVAEGHDRFVVDACLAMQVRLDRVPAAQQAQVNDGVRQLASAPLLYFARQCLAAAGVRVPEFAAPEEVFEQAFAMEGANNHVSVGASYSPYNRPGSFPNLMSNLANKLLDTALELAGTTYSEWTGMWPGDLPDFKPAPIVNKSQHDEMDEILDAEASKEFGLAEELLSYMVLRRYSNKFELTPVMAANDDLGAFDEGLLGLESAWQNTVNRLCLRLLTGNVTLLDSFALYDDTNHGNDLTGTGSGPPSVASWDVMQQKVSAQRGVGGTGYVRTPLAIALVPPKVYTAAIQTFAPLSAFGELKQATADTSLNVFRTSGVTVVKEPELQATSNDVWYGFARPRGLFNSTIVRAYFRGWGRNGRRQRWYDPETKCWNFELEGRVGAAAKQYRLTVRNDGVV